MVTPGSIPSPPAEQDVENPTLRILIAACVSALLPGVGQLQLGKKLQGIVFLLLLVVLLLFWWPVRIPLYLPGLIAIVLSTVVLAVSASTAIVITHKQPSISKIWLTAVIPAALLAAIVQVNCLAWISGFRSYMWITRSMEKTILENETIWGDLRYYKNGQPARGELIIFTKNNLTFIKRVEAVGGDTIQGRNYLIFLNGKQLDEPYVQHIATRYDPALPQLRDFGPIYVPPGKLFVLGDNRDNSYDSRTKEYGLIDVAWVEGKPLYILRSPDGSRVGMKIK